MTASGFEPVQVSIEEFHVKLANCWATVSYNNFDFRYRI